MSKLEPGSGDSEGDAQPLIGIQPIPPRHNHENLDDNRESTLEICQVKLYDLCLLH